MIRWGIIGCGGIANKMADALYRTEDAELVAVAARTLPRAEDFAAKHNVARAYGSYAELAADPDVDAVYVATIHPTHAMAVELCLNAGKAVLCEKPFGMTKAEGDAMFALAKEKNLLLMEAIWTRFLPAWRKAKELVESGAIGDVKTVYTDFSIKAGFDPESRLFNMEKGGGCTLDLGVYSLHCALYILGNDVKSVQAVGRLSPTGSDNYAVTTMQFESGAVAVAASGMDCCGGTCEARIMGEHGSIVMPGMMGSDVCILRRDGHPEEVLRFPYENGFTFEVEEFQSLLKAGKCVSEIATPEATLTVAGIMDTTMDQIRKSN